MSSSLAVRAFRPRGYQRALSALPQFAIKAHSLPPVSLEIPDCYGLVRLASCSLIHVHLRASSGSQKDQSVSAGFIVNICIAPFLIQANAAFHAGWFVSESIT